MHTLGASVYNPNLTIEDQVKRSFVSFCSTYSQKKIISQDMFDFAHDVRDQIIKDLNAHQNQKGLEASSS